MNIIPTFRSSGVDFAFDGNFIGPQRVGFHDDASRVQPIVVHPQVDVLVAILHHDGRVLSQSRRTGHRLRSVDRFTRSLGRFGSASDHNTQRNGDRQHRGRLAGWLQGPSLETILKR